MQSSVDSRRAAEKNADPIGSARREAARLNLADLHRRLRRERAMARCGHDGYDLSRHLALAQMVKRAEAAYRQSGRATAMQAKKSPPPRP